MQLTDIFDEWDKDAVMDKAYLEDVAINIPILHAKYSRLLSNQRLISYKRKADLAILRGDKRAWYLGEMSEDQLRRCGWPQYQGIVLKNQVDSILASDADLVSAQLKLDLVQENVFALTDIVKQINNRSYQIKPAVDYMKFKAGVG